MRELGFCDIGGWLVDDSWKLGDGWAWLGWDKGGCSNGLQKIRGDAND